MSDARWCDYGDHAMKASDDNLIVTRPPRRVTMGDQFGKHVVNVEAESIEVCPKHAEAMGFSNSPAIETAEPQ